jgi:signal transduction histidine kinase
MGRHNTRRNRYKLTAAVLSVIALLLTGPAVGASDRAVDVCSLDGLKADGGIELGGPWRYHAGDNPQWADPDFDDSDWREFSPDFTPDRLPPDWEGIGWFRIDLHVGPDMFHLPLALTVTQFAASEIYLDGRKIHALGRVSHTKDEEEIFLSHTFPSILPIQFGDSPEHVLAVRMSYNADVSFFGDKNHQMGISLVIRHPVEAIEEHESELVAQTRTHVFFGSLALAFSILHLLLFVFYPKSESHLYYSIFTFFAGVICFYPLVLMKTTDIAVKTRDLRIMLFAIVLVTIFGLRFLYSVFYDNLPKIFWFWVGAGIAAGILAWNGPMTRVFVFCLLVFVENFRVLIRAIAKRKPSAWVIAVGSGAFIVATAVQMLMEAGYLPNVSDKLYIHGLFVMLVLMSVYLARTRAQDKKDLERQLARVRELSEQSLEQERRAQEQEKTRMRLEADNALKEIELEEAYKRQKVLDELAAKNRELRDTQAQLIQSEKMASLGNLVAGVAHEINTPVGAINSMHNTMTRAFEKLKTAIQGRCPDGAVEDKNITNAMKVIEDANSVINSGAERVTEIVKRLRSFARLDEAELKTINIHDGIDDTLMLVHHQLKRHVTVKKDFGDVPPISCFPGQLNQVFVNILINAGQAIEGTGEVSIKTWHEDGGVFIEFKDTGKGISEDELRKIFDPGYTTKGVGVGTGLGLSICYQIIQAHKGDINVTSEVGKGTTFVIRLPDNLDELIETRDSQTPPLKDGP